MERAWLCLMQWWKVRAQGECWTEYLTELCRAVTGKGTGKIILKAMVTKFVYVVWMERNQRVFTKSAKDVNQPLREVVSRAIGRCLIDWKLNPPCWEVRGVPRV